MIIDDSTDLDTAAQDIVTSAYGYSGQKCSAASRAILHADVYDEVLQKVVEKAKVLKMGAPGESGRVYGSRHKRAAVRESLRLRGGSPATWRLARTRANASWARTPEVPGRATSFP
jgi:acyl-CoA reductase-like NAD-dependent aldehyde dehydrogenase